MINGVVYAAFGGHCDYFNYTGMVIGVNAASKKVVTAFAMESGSLAQHKTLDVRGGGGEAGIWMSGMGLASDGNRLFFVTVILTPLPGWKLSCFSLRRLEANELQGKW